MWSLVPECRRQHGRNYRWKYVSCKQTGLVPLVESTSPFTKEEPMTHHKSWKKWLIMIQPPKSVATSIVSCFFSRRLKGMTAIQFFGSILAVWSNMLNAGELWANRTPTECSKDLGNIWGLWNYCILLEEILPSGYQTFIDGASRDWSPDALGLWKVNSFNQGITIHCPNCWKIWEMERSKFGDLEIYGAYHLFDVWPFFWVPPFKVPRVES